MNKLITKIELTFKQHFEGEPIIVSSPGRVNIIGEHTDYNNGFVLPAAINKIIVFAVAKNDIDKIRLISTDMEIKQYEQNLSDPVKKTNISWVNYILGVVHQLQKRDKNVTGFDCVFGGNIPIGAGLSSSAALEGGIAVGLNKLFKLGLNALEIVKIAQLTENEFVGVQCGIMDQFANIFGRKNRAILLDCKTLEYTYVPVKSREYKFVLCDTKIRRELADSEYNKRIEQCESGVAILQDKYPGIQSLREVDISMLDTIKQDMPPLIYKRCRYVVEENERVLESVEHLKEGNYNTLGTKMVESHKGLRDQYEVSCRELDILVDTAEKHEHVLGARMMGGGFGGCTINLMHVDRKDQCVDFITKQYQKKTGKNLEIYTVKVDAGTEIITTDH